MVHKTDEATILIVAIFQNICGHMQSTILQANIQNFSNDVANLVHKIPTGGYFLFFRKRFKQKYKLWNNLDSLYRILYRKTQLFIIFRFHSLLDGRTS